jgi:hypothetical protein
MSGTEDFEFGWLSQVEDSEEADDAAISSTDDESESTGEAEKSRAWQETDEEDESEDNVDASSSHWDSSCTDENSSTDDDATTNDNIVPTDEEPQLASGDHFIMSSTLALEAIATQLQTSKRHQNAKSKRFNGYDLAELQTYIDKGPRWLNKLGLSAILKLCVRRHGQVVKPWKNLKTFGMHESYCEQGGSWSAEAGIRELIQNWYIWGLTNLVLTVGGTE